MGGDGGGAGSSGRGERMGNGADERERKVGGEGGRLEGASDAGEDEGLVERENCGHGREVYR